MLKFIEKCKVLYINSVTFEGENWFHNMWQNAPDSREVAKTCYDIISKMRKNVGVSYF